MRDRADLHKGGSFILDKTVRCTIKTVQIVAIVSCICVLPIYYITFNSGMSIINRNINMVSAEKNIWQHKYKSG